MPRFEFDLVAVNDAVTKMSAAVDEAMADALTQAARDIAETAQADHAFENRTGTLEREIFGREARGNFTDGTLYADVTANTAYAEYVEDKMPYLQPAADANADGIEHALDDALDRAAERAGWR
jgi:hypothetical protein